MKKVFYILCITTLFAVGLAGCKEKVEEIKNFFVSKVDNNTAHMNKKNVEFKVDSAKLTNGGSKLEILVNVDINEAWKVYSHELSDKENFGRPLKAKLLIDGKVFSNNLCSVSIPSEIIKKTENRRNDEQVKVNYIKNKSQLLISVDLKDQKILKNNKVEIHITGAMCEVGDDSQQDTPNQCAPINEIIKVSVN